MALVQADLADALQATFESLPATSSAAAAALAKDYTDYAAAGTFGASTIAFSQLLIDAMAATLQAAIAAPSAGSPAAFASAWGTALTTLWVGVPVTGTPSGVTVGCPGAVALVAALTTVFGNLANTAESCANGMAAALHTATLTVTAAVAPPPGTVLPIS